MITLIVDRARWILVLAGILAITGCATQVQQASVREVRQVPQGTDAKPIQFRKVVVRLRRGEEIGKSHVGLACLPQGTIDWRGGRVTISDDEFTDAFREELQKYNYPVVGDPNALFDDPSSWKAELLVAGQINKLEVSACFPMAGFGNWKDSKGGAFIRVQWQIYGQLERKVVYEVTTEGSFQSANSTPFGIEKAMTNAFAVATQNLLADEKFHQLVISRGGRSAAPSPSDTANPVISTDANGPLTIRAPAAAQTSLTRARDASVTVFAGSGHGSGVLVSPDGFVLTNEHVVREARFVRVRLANGREVLGDVLRTHNPRDVALIRLREQNLPSAVLAPTLEPPVGADVYAIGTPRRESLDVTVTRGIVSAYRDERGQKYIQSDVQIHPGNSGGPLVASDGQVVGLAVQGIMVGGATQNLNFFIPIGSALAALNVQLR
jgi:S1-C subfamily serine protease